MSGSFFFLFLFINSINFIIKISNNFFFFCIFVLLKQTNVIDFITLFTIKIAELIRFKFQRRIYRQVVNPISHTLVVLFPCVPREFTSQSVRIIVNKGFVCSTNFCMNFLHKSRFNKLHIIIHLNLFHLDL